MYRDNARPALLVTAFKNKVFGLDRDTGEVRWRVAIEDFAANAVELAIDETTVIACSSFNLVFIDYATGAVRKRVTRHDAAKGVRPVMVLADGHLYIGGSGELTCYTSEGEHRWDQGFKGEGYGTVTLGLPHLVRQADEKG
jgi:outer membrane protein assembly factor BamB